MKKILNGLIIAFVVLFSTISSVFAAGSASGSFSGSSTVTTGNNVSLSINVSNVSGPSDGKIYSLGGFVHFDPEYLQYVSFDGAGGWSGSTGALQTNQIKIATLDLSLSKGVSNGAVGTIVFKTKKAGTTTVSMTGAEATDQSGDMEFGVTFSNKSITIQDPAPALDSDSKLKSLSVEGYSLSPSFSSGTKSYTVNVPEGTSSVNISAAANSSKAKSVTGTGTKTLSGDTSSFNVVCTAENGSSTTYTITVKRAKKEEPTPTPTPEPAKKSSDSSLKYLSVSGYTLSPSFRSGTTEYSMTVGNGVTGLYVQATPNDSKATYVISGDDHWDVGKNTITIKVTA